MPLPLPKSRPDRPRRRVERSEMPVLREPPVRTYSFDPDAARQAWRQVARTRGANAMRLDGRDTGSRLAPIALGLVALAAIILWFTSGEDPQPDPDASPAAGVAAPGERPEQPSPAERLALAPTPEPMARSGPVGAPMFAEPVADEAPPPPPPRIDRQPPPGTPEHHAFALEKLPRSSYDRAPLGGIGPGGLHIDRITMGTSYEDGACKGPIGKFSLKNERYAHLCFRAVHPRKTQRVIVLWEHEGNVERRTFIRLGATHGYRTRAVLSLRHRPKGSWTARVMSSDGVELARHAFEIL